MSYRPWTTGEERIIREHYPDGGAVAVRRLLPHRAAGSIRTRAWQMGLSAPARGQWSDDEDTVLRSVYPLKGVAGVQCRLPDRTHLAIQTRAFLLGVKKRRAAV